MGAKRALIIGLAVLVPGAAMALQRGAHGQPAAVGYVEEDDGPATGPRPGVWLPMTKKLSAGPQQPVLPPGGAGTGAAAPPLACNPLEAYVLKPLHSMVTMMTGRVTTNQTIVPVAEMNSCNRLRAPDPQHPNLHLAASNTPSYSEVASCYHEIGFSRPVAICYADEHLKRHSQCGELCLTDAGGCQVCLSGLRRERQGCVHIAMGISPACSQCEDHAAQFWEHECVQKCRNAFDGDVALATQACRECNDNFYAVMAKRCGSVDK